MAWRLYQPVWTIRSSPCGSLKMRITSIKRKEVKELLRVIRHCQSTVQSPKNRFAFFQYKRNLRLIPM